MWFFSDETMISACSLLSVLRSDLLTRVSALHSEQKVDA